MLLSLSSLWICFVFLDRIPLDELSSSGISQGSRGRSPLSSIGNRVVLLGDALHAGDTFISLPA
jgi:hypothetical protein